MMNFLTENLNEPIDGDFLITSGREFHKTASLPDQGFTSTIASRVEVHKSYPKPSKTLRESHAYTASA